MQNVNVVYVSRKTAVREKVGHNLLSPGLTTSQEQLQKALIRFDF